jgi:glycerol-3-phosphate dehydrogenase subunit B
MHYDLIVIGMGLSGLMAAKTAAEMGKKVLIIGRGTGSLCLFSNTIDVLGDFTKQSNLIDGLSNWIKDHPQHPYARIGVKRVEEALSSFATLFQGPYSFRKADTGNWSVLTGAGTFRPACMIPTTMVVRASLKEGDVLIAGFKGFKDFYARYVSNHLGCRGVTLSLPDGVDREVTAAALARFTETESFRRMIGREIKKRLDGESCVGLPAILGVRDPFKVKRDLEEAIGAEVFEIPHLPPSIPGLRIFNRFQEWFIQKGVTSLLGHPVSGTTVKGKRCEGVVINHPPVHTSYSADHYILSTGRFVGGGLTASEDKISEPIFNLPVAQPKSREEWFQKSFFDSNHHPVHGAGILADSSLRPIDERGNVLLENVWVAGTILAGHHCIDEKSREGIEIATGYCAARNTSGQRA